MAAGRTFTRLPDGPSCFGIIGNYRKTGGTSIMPANRTKATFDVGLEDIIVASHALKDAVRHTPLMRDDVLSQRYNCNVYLKREDLQVVRSFKIRGAYNFMRNLDEKERARGVVCASAGNHAQGVAWSCRAMQIRGTIFMPTTTP